MDDAEQYLATIENEKFTLMNNFGVTGGNERLYMDEKLRAKSSNDCLY